MSDAYLVLANAYPYSDLPSRASNAAFREALRDKSLEIVQAMRERLEGLPEQRSSVKIIANPSPAHALHRMADVDDAELIVVGSTHTSRAGRVLPGSTGERLIHGSPCAVAVVPTDYRKRTEPIRKVGVAYNETPEARVAVFAAAKLAKAFGAELVVIGVADASGFEAPALMGGPSVASVRVDIDRHVQESLDALVAELPDDVTATTKRLTGDPADLLADSQCVPRPARHRLSRLRAAALRARRRRERPRAAQRAVPGHHRAARRGGGALRPVRRRDDDDGLTCPPPSSPPTTRTPRTALRSSSHSPPRRSPGPE